VPAVNADLHWAIEDVRDRLPALKLLKDYDEGVHRLLFATDKYRKTFGDLFREFADNMCDDVVNSITDRLQIVGFTGPTDEVTKAAMAMFDANQGEARTGEIHRHGFRDGDGFAIVQENQKGQVRWFQQDPRMMAIRYSTDSPDELELVGKVWKEGKRYRVNLYYPGRKHPERWASKGLGANGGLPQAASFGRVTDGDPSVGGGAVPQQEESDLGVPVFHYPNGALSGYGKSILAGVIPLQDALNKSISDMLVAMEFHAYPQRWGTGIEVSRDPVTNVEDDPFKAGEGRFWRVAKEGAKMGQFDAAEMTGFLDVQDSFKVEIGRKGYLPSYAVQLRNSGGDQPSGINLLVSEGRTIKLAKDRHRDWGLEHRRMMAYGLNLQTPGAQVTAADLDLNWAPPETRDEQAMWELFALKAERGVPDEVLLEEGGYDPKKIADWMRDREAKAEQDQADTIASLALARGNAGKGLPGGPVPPAGGQSALAGA
jgi:hypothetical protein